MATVIYIHGFLSSPQSQKAVQTRQWFQEHLPHVSFCCPQLSSYPDEINNTLVTLIKSLGEQKIFAIGSSLGGYWATYLLEKGLIKRAVLINPAVLPATRFRELVGQRLKSYYSDDYFTLTEKHIKTLGSFEAKKIAKPKHYWLMVQKGDKTLDHRLAVDKYARCKQLVEEGGSHAFIGYENYLPEIAAFFNFKPFSDRF